MNIDYWIVDDQTLGVGVVGGIHETCSITKTTETAVEVRVTAQCREPFFPGAGTAVGFEYEFVVRLDEPLDNRVVVDGSGNPAHRCTYPGCAPPS